MRIIAGKFRGRRLTRFKADHIRPTTDQIKESIFNKLQAYWEGAHVLDLYSGTGNLSIEAISREASSVTAVEKSPASASIIRRNLAEFGIIEQVDLIVDDACRFVGRYHGPAFDVILCDPPFTEQLADKTMKALATSSAVGPDSVIVMESSSKEILLESYDDLESIDRRDYGDKVVSLWRRRRAPESK